MGPAALMALICGAFFLIPLMTGQDEDMVDDGADDVTDPADSVNPVNPDTLGASFSETDDVVAIEFGEKETRSLAVITYVDVRVNSEPSTYIPTHEARYYLVPDGVDWPDNTSETAGDIPGERDFGGFQSNYFLSDFEEHFGLTLLGPHHLLAEADTFASPENMTDGLPELTANRDAGYYYLESGFDNRALTSYLQERCLVTRNGVTETLVTEDTIGTDRIDWLTADAGGITVNGAAGDDVLLSEVANVVFEGGDGNDFAHAGGVRAIINGDDLIKIEEGGTTIDGGAGDNRIRMFGSIRGSVINGGRGVDNILSFGGNVNGGTGNDNIEIFHRSGAAYGDEGDDLIEARYSSGSRLYGGVGDDVLYERSGDSELFGDEGNDRLTARKGFNRG